MKLINTISVISLLASISYGHIAIVEPVPRKGGEDRSPIGSVQQNTGLPICHNATPETPKVTVKAGGTLALKFSPNGAAHGGGHCQFAISYDNKQFAVIQDELKHCFKGAPSSDNAVVISSYDIKLPAELPSGTATIAWTWINAIGNREYYMGCVDVTVEGGSGDSFTGPELLFVNHPTLGGGKTIPEFNGNYETGLDLFKGRPKITIKGSGGAAQPAYATGGAAPAITPSANGYGASFISAADSAAVRAASSLVALSAPTSLYSTTTGEAGVGASAAYLPGAGATSLFAASCTPAPATAADSIAVSSPPVPLY